MSHQNKLTDAGRRSLSLFGIILSLIIAAFATSYGADITSRTSGNWNATTTWNGGVVPGSGDNVYIANGHTVTVTANAGCGNLYFKDNNSSQPTTEGLVVNAGITLTVTGAVVQQGNSKQADAVTIGGSGSLVCASFTMNQGSTPGQSSTTVFTLSLSIGRLDISGDLSIRGTFTAPNKYNNSELTVSSGTINLGGRITTSNANASNSCSFLMGSSSPRLNLSSSGNSFSISGTGTTIISLNGTGAVVNYIAAGAQNIYNTTYTTLEVNNSSGASLLAATSVANLTIGNTTANALFSDAGFALTANGTLNLTSGTMRLGNGASATSFPAFGTVNIQASTTVDFASSAAQSIPAYNFGSVTNTGNGNRTLASTGVIGIASSFSPGTGTYTVTGSQMNFNGLTNQQVPAFTFNDLSMSGSGTAKSALGNIVVNGNLAVSANVVFDLTASYLLSGGFTNTSSPGTIKTAVSSSTSATPIPTGKTWDGTIEYYSLVDAQTVVSGTYNHLTLTNTSPKNAGGNMTVNGILSLAANPNADRGQLEMTIDYGNYAQGQDVNSTSAINNLNSYILTMGLNSSTIGAGDVTGKIRRTTIASQVIYTFGNANMQLSFNNAAGGNLPTQITVVATRGTTYGQHYNNTTQVYSDTDARNKLRSTVKRLYQVLRTGGTNPTLMNIRLPYSDEDLNGNLESALILWDHHLPYSNTWTPHEHGKTNQNIGDNWVALSGHMVEYLGLEGSSSFTKYWMLSSKETSNGFTWLGAVAGNNWNNPSNWNGGTVPDANASVIIPAVEANRFPKLPASGSPAVVGTIYIEPGAILESESGAVLTVYGGPKGNGGSGSWLNLGNYVPNDGKVIFTYDSATIAGTTDFYDLEIPDTAWATLQNQTVLGIMNSIITNGRLDATLYSNSINYKKNGDQTVINPNGKINGAYQYDTLILSGSGIKSIGFAPLTVKGSFTLSGAASTSPAGAVSFDGNVLLGSGTSFTVATGSTTMVVKGNFTNNGCNFEAATGTVSFAGVQQQIISGNASSTQFANMTLASTASVVNKAYIKINGDLAVGAGGSFDAGSFENTVEYNAIRSNPSSQTVFAANGATPGYYNLILGGAGSKVMPAGALKVAQDMTINGTASVIAAGPLDIEHNFVIGIGAQFDATFYTHHVGGTWSYPGISNGFTAGTSTFVMDGINNIVTNDANLPFYNLTIASDGNCAVNKNVEVLGTLSLESGVLQMGAHTLTLKANTLTRSNGSIDVSDPASVVVFEGTASQDIPAGFFSGDIGNLTIKNANGVNSHTNLRVTGLTTLTTGKLDVKDFELETGSISGGATDNYVKTSGAGALLMTVAQNDETHFPVGNASYNPILIRNASGSEDGFSVRVMNEVYNNGYNGSNFTNYNRVTRSWDIGKQNPNAGQGIDIVFYWNAGEIADGQFSSTPSVYHFNGTEWRSETGSDEAFNPLDQTYYRINGYTGSFSPFAVVEAYNTILPLKSLLIFAQQSGDNVKVNFTTEQELNVKYFIVQHSLDGKQWSNLTQLAARNGAGSNAYSFVHTAPAQGVNYYRIMQRDLDNKLGYSAVASVNVNKGNSKVSAYPNPVTTGTLFVQLPKACELKIVNSNGNVLLRGMYGAGQQRINTSQLPKGIYWLMADNQIIKVAVE